MNVIDYQPKARKSKPKATFKHTTEKVVRSLIITLALMIVSLVGATFILMNNSAQKGYTLTQHKLRNEELKTENESISTRIVGSKAVSEIDKENLVEIMTEAEQKTYVTKEDNTIK